MQYSRKEIEVKRRAIEAQADGVASPGQREMEVHGVKVGEMTRAQLIIAESELRYALHCSVESPVEGARESLSGKLQTRGNYA